jgi:hypothetical protein
VNRREPIDDQVAMWERSSFDFVRQMPPRLGFDSESYAALRLRVLNRDGWGCQRCGSLQNLQVHHVRSRSDGVLQTAD